MILQKAECGALSSNLKLLQPIGTPRERKFQYSKPHCRLSTRSHKIALLPFPSVRLQNAAGIQKSTSVSRKISLRPNCFGSLVSSEFEAVSDLVVATDQTLLMVSIFLTYVAGAIPAGTVNQNSQRKLSDAASLPENPTVANNSAQNEQIRPVWEFVKEKLKESLHAIEQGDIMENSHFEIDSQQANQPMSLNAIADGPRLRLLQYSVEKLEKEVNELPDMLRPVDRDELLLKFSTAIQKACQEASISWVEEAFLGDKYEPDRVLLSSLSEKLRADSVISRSIMKSGKMDLYVDLLYYLRYGSCREGCLYDHNLYTSHGASILEDLVITIADGISSIYLELISVDGDISDKVNDLGSSLCTLTTRELQKMRNKVTMNKWLYQNFEAVASMYEDRFDLCTLETQTFQRLVKKNGENVSWWKKFVPKKSATSEAQLRYAVICPISIRIKRTKELRALRGWKYYFSLVLELSDIMEPLVKAAIARVSKAISFFLVTLIGRSLGLVCTGIRQSLRWK